jgi:hypothetical protein
MSLSSLRRPFQFAPAMLCVRRRRRASGQSRAVGAGQGAQQDHRHAQHFPGTEEQRHGSQATCAPAPTTRSTTARGTRDEPASTFYAKDILVLPYHDMAALTFCLVYRSADDSTECYRNSGTFLRRNRQWQAVTWQATKVAAPAKQPEDEEEWPRSQVIWQQGCGWPPLCQPRCQYLSLCNVNHTGP